MSETTVRVLAEDQWEEYKALRLRALQEAPGAFVASYEDETDYDEDFWRRRMRRSRRLLAEQDDAPVGIVSVRPNDDLYDNAAEIFGLWVDPDLRGAGVAAALVEEAVAAATVKGYRQLIYWVVTDNARGVAFASSWGFRPTAHRRPVRVRNEHGEEEIALVLALHR